MLAEYLMLALSVGLLGRAARRLERHTRVQRHLIEFACGLTRTLDPDTVLRQGVEAGVRLSGADGGFAATASDAGWRTDAVFRDGHWHAQPLSWWPPATAPWEQSAASRWQLCEGIVPRRWHCGSWVPAWRWRRPSLRRNRDRSSPW